MPFRALCLDFDGVIADTENVHVAAWQRTFMMMGWEAADDFCALATHEDDRKFLADAFAARGVEGADVEGWARRKQEVARALLTDAPRLFPGVAELLNKVAGRRPVAVVSTTWRENVEAVLGAAGLLRNIALIVGKEDVASPKPSPEPYRLAVERLGVAPGEALAVEDSETGVTSALQAGLKALYVGTGPLHSSLRENVLTLENENDKGDRGHLASPRRLLELLGWDELLAD